MAPRKTNSSPLTVADLKAVVPTGKLAIIEPTVVFFNQWADKLDINTPLRKAHFIAQIAHESAHFNTTVEYGGKKARYAPWYGRGLIQTTWKENYEKFTAWCNKHELQNPDFATPEHRDAVALFPWAFLCAVWYWQEHGLNQLADADNIRAITKRINGGYNGLDDRIQYLNRAKKVFGVTPANIDVAPGSIMTKHSAEDIQRALIAKGFNLTVDGTIGPKTITAIKAFQKYNELVPDGIVGPVTAKVLFS